MVIPGVLLSQNNYSLSFDGVDDYVSLYDAASAVEVGSKGIKLDY